MPVDSLFWGSLTTCNNRLHRCVRPFIWLCNASISGPTPWIDPGTEFYANQRAKLTRSFKRVPQDFPFPVVLQYRLSNFKFLFQLTSFLIDLCYLINLSICKYGKDRGSNCRDSCSSTIINEEAEFECCIQQEPTVHPRIFLEGRSHCFSGSSKYCPETQWTIGDKQWQCKTTIGFIQEIQLPENQGPEHNSSA